VILPEMANRGAISLGEVNRYERELGVGKGAMSSELLVKQRNELAIVDKGRKDLQAFKTNSICSGGNLSP
jgi:hypothetical protein